jgi:hypothetical protein
VKEERWNCSLGLSFLLLGESTRCHQFRNDVVNIAAGVGVELRLIYYPHAQQHTNPNLNYQSGGMRFPLPPTTEAASGGRGDQRLANGDRGRVAAAPVA